MEEKKWRIERQAKGKPEGRKEEDEKRGNKDIKTTGVTNGKALCVWD